MKRTLTIILTAAIFAIMLSACGESPAKSKEPQTEVQGSESISGGENNSSGERIVPVSLEGIYVNDAQTHYLVIESDFATVDGKGGSSISVKTDSAIGSPVYSFSYDGKTETFFDDNGSFMCSIGAEPGIHNCWSRAEKVPDIAESTKNPIWLQGGGSSFEVQLSTNLVSEVKSNSEKVMYVNFAKADGSCKMVLTILYTDSQYSGYINKNETGEVFNGDLVFVRDDFINFRFDSKYYSEFADITSYQVFLYGGDIGVPYPFENCIGGEFTPESESPASGEVNMDDADTLPMVGNTYKNSDGTTLQIIHSNSDGCITAIKFDDILLDLTNAQFMPDYGPWKDAYTGDFDNGLQNFSAIYNKSNDTFDVWFTILTSELWDGRTPMKFDADRFMGTYTIKSYGNNWSGVSTQNSYPFIGITYKNEDIDLTFKLQSPDANGYPTEIVLNGVTYSDDVTFNNETFALENVTITVEKDNCYTILANWSAKGLEFSLNMDGEKGWWKMYGPAMCSGYYYP